MITNELMRHLLTDISEDDRRHLVEVVDRNHADQLARKRRARPETDPSIIDGGSLDWDEDSD
jgi:hypothetical protein